MSCKHPLYDRFIHIRHIRTPESPGHPMQIEYCGRCGFWMSLGPSNDTGVEHEIEAARIQTDGRVMSMIMSCPDELLTSPIGYLARCITEHKP